MKPAWPSCVRQGALQCRFLSNRAARRIRRRGAGTGRARASAQSDARGALGAAGRRGCDAGQLDASPPRRDRVCRWPCWSDSKPPRPSPSPCGNHSSASTITKRICIRRGYRRTARAANFSDFQPNSRSIVSGGHTLLVLVESELKPSRARLDGGRRGGRMLRQDRQADGAAVSRRPGD